MDIILRVFIATACLFCFAHAQVDVTGNGASDLVLLERNNDQLEWFVQELATDTLKALGVFGLPDSQVSFSNWGSKMKPSRVMVVRKRNGWFELQSEHTDESLPLAFSADAATVILDSDVSGNGLTDALVVTRKKRRLRWLITLDPFNQTTAKRRRLAFGRRGLVFSFRSRGRKDVLAVLDKRGRRTPKLLIRSMQRRRVRTKRVKGDIPLVQPRKLRVSDNRDLLIFEDKKQVRFLNSRGRLEGGVVEVPENAEIVIGDFDGDGTESLSFMFPESAVFNDGREVRLQRANAKPLGKVSVSYDSDQASTPSPTNSPTPTPVNTVALPTVTTTPTATSTLRPTSTSIPTATLTPSPTATSVPTSTATLTATPTATPTVTLIPTSTLTPTVTSTPDIQPPAAVTLVLNHSNLIQSNVSDLSVTLQNAELGTRYSVTIDDEDNATAGLVFEGTVSTSSLQLSGIDVGTLSDGVVTIVATLKDGSGNVSTPTVKVLQKDVVAPQIQSVSSTAGTFAANSNIDFRLVSSEDLVVQGTPKISINMDSGVVQAAYLSSESSGTELVFRYTVVGGDVDNDGVVLDSEITLDGGSIKDSLGNNADLSLPTVSFPAVLVAGALTDCAAYLNAGFTNDGVYTIDPDGSAGASPPMSAYCDMTTDGGGWTLILNYNHQANTNPSIQVRTSDLPLQGSISTNGGASEVSTQYWGHASNSLTNLFSYTELRFYCERSSGVRRTHFKTNNSNCITYARTGTGQCNLTCGSITELSNDQSNRLPTQFCSDNTKNSGRSNQGDTALTNGILLNGGSAISFDFSIKGDGTHWTCDEEEAGFSLNTWHQIWLR